MAMKDAEARHVAAKTAKKNEKQKQKSRQVPVSKPVASPQNLQSMAAEAGADADFLELLSAFEQQVLNLRIALSSASNTMYHATAPHSRNTDYQFGSRRSRRSSTQ